MNQAELRQMAEERIRDAKALIDGGRWEFAYYAAGYAIECALKSCVLARMIHTGWVFQEKVKVGDCLTHEFKKLIKIAGLRDELGRVDNSLEKRQRLFRRISSLPPCGGGLGWGVASSEGHHPHPNPPPSRGREPEGRHRLPSYCQHALDSSLAASAAAGGEFVTNWATVDLWGVISRYEARTEAEAKKLFAAITDEPHGVLQWIRNYW